MLGIRWCDLVLVLRVFSVGTSGWPRYISVARLADIEYEIFVCIGAAPVTAARGTPDNFINGEPFLGSQEP